MAVLLSPLGGAAVQFLDNNGNPLSGGLVYTYAAGTTTPQTTYTSSSGSTPQPNPIILDSAGRVPVGEIWLTTTVLYKFTINTSLGVLVGTYDNIAGLSDLNLATLAASTGSSIIGWIRNAVGAVFRWVSEKLAENVDLADFGGGPSITDNTSAVAAAMTHLRLIGGGVLNLPTGNLVFNGAAGTDGVLNGLLFKWTSDNGTLGKIVVKGKGRATVLLAGSNNMILVRMSDSNCGLRDVTLSGNGMTGIIAHALIPEDLTQTASVVSQNFNYCSGVYIRDCDEGVQMRCGPRVGGLQSGCFYNSLTDYHIYNTIRGLWLRSATAASGSTVNRNKFTNIRIGGGTRSNTGIQIDSGDTNTFIGVDGEGINSTTGPNAVPTAYKIVATDPAAGLDNQMNVFVSCKSEACVRDLDNAAPTTELYGCYVTGSKILLTAQPRVMVGGDPSVAPQIMPGYKWQSNTFLPGVANNVLWLGGGIAAASGNYVYDQGYSWSDYAITPAICTNVTTVAEYHSKFQRLGGMIDWSVRIRFQATSATTNITITLPRTPSVHYTQFNLQQPMFIPIVVVGASGVAIPTTGRFDAANPSTFIISVPTGSWYPGADSEAHVSLRYIEVGY